MYYINNINIQIYAWFLTEYACVITVLPLSLEIDVSWSQFQIMYPLLQRRELAQTWEVSTTA